MATPSSILAWDIPWTEEPEGYSPWVHKETRLSDEHFHFSFTLRPTLYVLDNGESERLPEFCTTGTPPPYLTPCPVKRQTVLTHAK